METTAQIRRRQEEMFYEFLLAQTTRILTIMFFSLSIITIIIMIDGDRQIKELEDALFKKETSLISKQIQQPMQQEFLTQGVPKLIEEVANQEQISGQEKQENIVTTANSLQEVTEVEVVEENIETADIQLSQAVEGITPSVVTMNTSSYCSCIKCCGKTDGITASGVKATSWHTVAAGKELKFGTIIYIPALANEPNGGWFVVEDRGGEISNNDLDIYLDSHSEASQYGRKDLECYIYEL